MSEPTTKLDAQLDALLARPVTPRPGAAERLQSRLHAANREDPADAWIDDLLAAHPMEASPSLEARVRRQIAEEASPATRPAWPRWIAVAAMVLFGLGIGLNWPRSTAPEAPAIAMAAAPAHLELEAQQLADATVFALLEGLSQDAAVLLTDPDLTALALAQP